MDVGASFSESPSSKKTSLRNGSAFIRSSSMFSVAHDSEAVDLNEMIQRYSVLYIKYQSCRREEVQGVLEGVKTVQKIAEGVRQSLSSDLIQLKTKFKRDYGLFNRLFSCAGSAQRFRQEQMEPKSRALSAANKLLSDCCTLIAQLTEESALFQVKEAIGRNVCAVVNDHSGRVEWKDDIANLCGVYNPKTQRVEWARNNGGLKGVYNPIAERVEWARCMDGAADIVFNHSTRLTESRTCTGGGVAGVYNPVTLSVEWKEVQGMYDVAGVFNPEQKCVEWKTCYRGAICGFWNVQTKRVQWVGNKVDSGVACVYWDGYGYSTAQGFNGSKFWKEGGANSRVSSPTPSQGSSGPSFNDSLRDTTPSPSPLSTRHPLSKSGVTPPGSIDTIRSHRV